MEKENLLPSAMKTKGLGQEAQQEPARAAKAQPARTGGKRIGKKHLGAYFDERDPILKRVAMLRDRLNMTNSELIEHALNEVWKRHEAGRAFGE